MIIANLIILGCLITATLFGVYGQDMSYFMNENIADINPIYYLTVLTITSVFLYFFAGIVTYISIKKQKIKKDKFKIYLLAIIIIGIPISLWSLFVLAMWWG